MNPHLESSVPGLAVGWGLSRSSPPGGCWACARSCVQASGIWSQSFRLQAVVLCWWWQGGWWQEVSLGRRLRGAASCGGTGLR